MMRIVLAALALFLAPILPAAAQPRIEEAVFAGGCFWCMEHDMGAIPGVISVESGYTGGRTRNPTYQNHEGHYEAVRVRFDASRITYRQLLERYWVLTDPTDAGGQFCDRGSSYRPAIFVTPAQRGDAEASRTALIRSGRVNARIVTPVLDLGPFYLAEEYHRDYARRNPGRYQRYREGCGRDVRLREVWGRR